MCGGGRGMRVMREQSDFKNSFDRAVLELEAKSAFGDGTVFIARFLERPRHIQVQILADAQGNVRASNLKEHREDPVMNSQNGAAVPAIRRVWEDRFPEDTRLMVYNNRSRVAMNPQSSIIKDFITAAIEKFKIDLLFNPPILNIKDNQHQKHQMLIDCANLSLVNGTCQYIWGVVGLYQQHVWSGVEQ
ncbi:carbamoyl-phosphate synthase L chain, ATP binding domain-containing protein [Irpex lacteus]|nr:carbamoyl-phosphate synthase L chain, ATP binding domain-containing protein [Irpex lacteus]